MSQGQHTLDPEVDLAPEAAFRPAVLARVPLAFPFGLDAIRHRPRTDGGQCLIVDQKMQRALRATVGDVSTASAFWRQQRVL